jgi:predicted ATPase/class 3 adenylate cyclase
MPVFLFADLEASTRHWEREPEAMRLALARHDEILGTAVTAAGGRVVKTTGDGLMAVFDSGFDCVVTCLEAQRALASASWETDEPLRVRMGAHVGAAEPRAGDFYGTAVNRAARIMAAAHGGQVLCSAAVVRLVDELPSGASFRDLGDHRLKDLTDPEHLFQLTHPDLPTDFPPLATLDARPNNLPVQVSEFVGRESELEAVRELLGRPAVRLLTLTGPGGTGKTRLSLQVAAEAADQYPDGAFFVDLSAERDADAAFETIQRDLGLTGAGEGSPLQVLQARLRDRRLLLVLDNFEQVTVAATGVAELLQRCPGLDVLVTSREALRIRGEHVFPVPPMAVPDRDADPAAIVATEAVALFVERARAVRPGFALTDAEARVVAEICARLDGLPLAIELAAARLNVFTVRELRDRLEGRMDVIGGGARDLPARQRTLRATIEWSYELLDADECRVFELLSVFSSARLASLEEVAAAVHDGLDVLDPLSSLVDKSLVRSVETAGWQRFTMLRTIRDYAAERLAASPDVHQTARLAHARYFSDHAATLRQALAGPGREATLAELSVEIGNLRTAWRYWVEEADLEQLYLLLDGLWALHDARGWYHAAVELTTDLLGVLLTAEPSSDRDREEMTLRTSLARTLMAVRGWTIEVEEEFKRALDLATSSGSAVHRFPVLRSLATYYLNVGDFDGTAAMGRELLDLAGREQDPTILVEGHLVLGLGTAFTGRTEEGLRHLDQAIALFDPSSHGTGRFRLGTSPGVVARIASAILLRDHGYPDRSAGRASEALELARRLDHPFTLAYALYHTGFLEVIRRRFEAVLERGDELAEVAAEHEYPVWRALASVLGGVARCGLGQADTGLAMTEAGHELYRGLSTPPVFWPSLLSLIADGALLAGQPERALELVDEAIAEGGSDKAALAVSRILRGDILVILDRDAAEAEASYRSAIAGARSVDYRLLELRATTRLVDHLRARGLHPDGSAELRGLYEGFTEGFDEPELVTARETLAGG